MRILVRRLLAPPLTKKFWDEKVGSDLKNSFHSDLTTEPHPQPPQKILNFSTKILRFSKKFWNMEFWIYEKSEKSAMRADCFSKKSDTNFPPLSYRRHKSKKNIEIQHIFLRGGIYLKSVAGIYLDGQYIILRFHPARVWAFADPFSGFKVKYAVFSSMSVKLCSGWFDTSLVSIPHLLLQKSYILSINKHSVKY